MVATWHNIPKDWRWISHSLIYPLLVSNLDRCKMVFTCVHQINKEHIRKQILKEENPGHSNKK